VVGRYVLLYNHDQPSMLRRLAKHLKAGGLIVFQEPTMFIAQSIPPVDLYERCRRWYMEGMRAGGAQIDTASDAFHFPRCWIAAADHAPACPHRRCSEYFRVIA
jgi:hypothetical protein